MRILPRRRPRSKPARRIRRPTATADDEAAAIAAFLRQRGLLPISGGAPDEDPELAAWLAEPPVRAAGRALPVDAAS